MNPNVVINLTINISIDPTKGVTVTTPINIPGNMTSPVQSSPSPHSNFGNTAGTGFGFGSTRGSFGNSKPPSDISTGSTGFGFGTTTSELPTGFTFGISKIYTRDDHLGFSMKNSKPPSDDQIEQDCDDKNNL